MKHFLVDITYLVEFDKIGEILPKHREFLQTGYDKKLLLMSGPKNPKTGGVVIARAESIDEIKSFFDNDPYKIASYASYDFLEFDPVKRQEFMEDWIAG